MGEGEAGEAASEERECTRIASLVRVSALYSNADQAKERAKGSKQREGYDHIAVSGKQKENREKKRKNKEGKK